MSKINTKRLSLVLISSLLMASCASSITMSSDEKTKAYANYAVDKNLESMQKITSFRFDGFSSLSDENIIIRTTFNRPYLITLRDRCVNLSFANVIKVNNTGSSLHVNFDSISVPENMNMNMNMSPKCFIKEIHKLTKEQQKEILKIGRETEEEKT
ncbi:MAG: hypothetical protein COA74_01460 [Gammaproteobacteria bacterium]|nr:MAG: hypothetical protein COA74_01460 [Gammaproteobacteria bacterium]